MESKFATHCGFPTITTSSSTKDSSNAESTGISTRFPTSQLRNRQRQNTTIADTNKHSRATGTLTAVATSDEYGSKTAYISASLTFEPSERLSTAINNASQLFRHDPRELLQETKRYIAHRRSRSAFASTAAFKEVLAEYSNSRCTSSTTTKRKCTLDHSENNTLDKNGCGVLLKYQRIIRTTTATTDINSNSNNCSCSCYGDVEDEGMKYDDVEENETNTYTTTTTKIMISSTSSSTTAQHLMTITEAPSWMITEYILTGYRQLTHSYHGCIKTFTYLHNETGNILTHLVGAIIFLWLAYYTFDSILPQSLHSSLMETIASTRNAAAAAAVSATANRDMMVNRISEILKTTNSKFSIDHHQSKLGGLFINDGYNNVRYEIPWQDMLVFGVYLLSATTCLVLSTLYHLFNCHSERVSID
ncbi:hypothetical protein H4219_004244 [Mycoemilia scoparia]|uniref:Uncharacterized protein n=1 Tax=Mycoemilia scoparia TaxID=417184 RepID=A0A9W8DN50_9FUNG|nr:hypothetical protein H4219_004244 [Mycoemilia scoparia]